MAAVTPSDVRQGYGTNVSKSYKSIEGGVPRFKTGYLTAPATTDDGDTITVDVYEKFGITKVLGVEGFIHTTTDSVIVEESPTTTVSMEDLTLTVGGSTDNKKRFYVVYGI